MILSLGQGEPSYIPDQLLTGRAQDVADQMYLAFLQCYARDPLQWDIICFFSHHQEEWCPLAILAGEMAQPESLIAERLAELAGMRLLYERVLNIGPQYCLTSSLELRRLVVRLGAEWS